jgi:hypothetical protein
LPPPLGAIHDGRTIYYSFKWNKKKYNPRLMTLSQIISDNIQKLAKEQEKKERA